MATSVQSRIKTFDLAKFIAIFAVLYGHSIQYLTSRPFYEDTVYQIIYSFHMPLFMIIVGYFSTHAYKKGFKYFAVKKFNQLIVPGIAVGQLFVY